MQRSYVVLGGVGGR